MSKIRIVLPYPGVLHIIHPNQRMQAKSWMRVQEFYESPLSDESGPFRGRHFSRDEFKKAYAKFKGTGVGFGEFTYYDDWNGFNVPGDVFDRFIELFEPDFMEETLVRLVLENREANGNYYVIGTHEQGSDVIDHELSHAFWYLDTDYKLRGKFLVEETLPPEFRAHANKVLRGMGYTDEVLDDEITAYLSTGTLYDIADDFETDDIPWGVVLDFQRHFYEHKESLDV